MAENLLKGYVDKVIYIPAGNNYNKAGLLECKHRIEMLKIMLKDNSNIEVSDIEIGGSLYTLNVLNIFKEKYPDDELYFICGADNLNELDTWHKYEEILQNYKLLVIARRKNNFDEIIKKYDKYRDRILKSEMEMNDISSTMIRKEIIENGFSDSLSTMMDDKVIEYLKSINYKDAWQI